MSDNKFDIIINLDDYDEYGNPRKKDSIIDDEDDKLIKMINKHHDDVYSTNLQSIYKNIKTNSTSKTGQKRKITRKDIAKTAVKSSVISVLATLILIGGINLGKDIVHKIQNPTSSEVIEMVSEMNHQGNIIVSNTHYPDRTNRNLYWYDNRNIAKCLMNIDYQGSEKCFEAALCSVYQGMNTEKLSNINQVIYELLLNSKSYIEYNLCDVEDPLIYSKIINSQLILDYFNDTKNLQDCLKSKGFINKDGNADIDKWLEEGYEEYPYFEQLYDDYTKVTNNSYER